ncbi:MAG: STAS domain-containing protein [Candidatus Delongbacteria bacterium]|jgi:anti-sigma B factor antagonist|nr:STAS domain-containing protein [Candidatus Delongbacteria bacterium]
MKTIIIYKGDVGVISVTGRLDASNTTTFKEEFLKWLNETNEFVLDLSRLEFIDSTGLGGIVACMKYASEKDGDLKIACLQSKPRMVFEITRANKIFDIYDDVATAVESYGS